MESVDQGCSASRRRQGSVDCWRRRHRESRLAAEFVQGDIRRQLVSAASCLPLAMVCRSAGGGTAADAPRLRGWCAVRRRPRRLSILLCGTSWGAFCRAGRRRWGSRAGGGWQRERILAALVFLIAAAVGRRHSLVVVIEDLHWSQSRHSRSLLGSKLALKAEAGLSLLLTARSDGVEQTSTCQEWLRAGGPVRCGHAGGAAAAWHRRRSAAWRACSSLTGLGQRARRWPRILCWRSRGRRILHRAAAGRPGPKDAGRDDV